MSSQGPGRRCLIGIVADDETLSGFSLTGIPLCRDPPNFVSVGGETADEDVEKSIQLLAGRPDVAIVLVADFVYPRVREYIEGRREALPCFLVIPSRAGHQ